MNGAVNRIAKLDDVILSILFILSKKAQQLMSMMASQIQP